MRDPCSFEEAMSLLVASIGHITSNLPSNETDSIRLAEQVARLDTIWVRNQGELLRANA